MADPQIRQQVMDVLANPMDLPSTFWDYATQNWLKDAPVFPISQVFGFAQFTASFAPYVAGASTRTSATFGALVDGLGPSVTSLPDGKYLAIWGCLAAGNPGVSQAQVRVIANGATASTNNCATSSATSTSIMAADILALTNGGNNTIVAQFASSDGASTATFSQRWIIALKYANN